VNKKNLILAVVLVVVVGLNLFMFVGLRHKSNKPAPGKVADQKNLATALQQLEEEKASLRELAGNLGINSLAREAEFSHTDISFYLYQRISALAEKQSVELVTFSPIKKEEKEGISKISFAGEINAPYADMVNFFRDVEDKERLFIEDLIIASAPDSPLTQRAGFTVSCFEFKDEVLKTLMLGAPAPQGHEDKALSISRDPFFSASESTGLAPSARAGKSGSPDDRALALTLTGVVGYPVPTAAIINHEIVRTGDKVQGKEVREIKPDQVVLQSGDQVYVLKLPEAHPPSPSEENPLSLSDSEDQR
jgi:hypothetical protein